MKVISWFKRIAQKYPGSTPGQRFPSKEKLQYWGMEPTNETPGRSVDNYNTHQMGRNINLTRIDSRHVATAIEHFAGKYYSIVREAVLQSIDPCENNEHLNIDFDNKKTPEIGQAYDNLWDDIDKTVASMLQRSEVSDEELSSELSNFMHREIEQKFAKMAHQEMMNMPLFVRVYGSSQAYGGPEEGGWWYSNVKMIDQHETKGRAEACKLANNIRQQMAKQRYELARQSYTARQSKYEDSMDDFPTFQEYMSDSAVRKDIDSRYANDIFYEDLMQGSGGVRDLYDEYSSKATGMGDLSYDTRDSEGMDFPLGWTTSAFENYFVTVEITPNPQNERTERPRYE